MAARAFNQATVYCDNPACVHWQVHKVVSYPLIGSGVFGRIPAFCECGSGSEMRIIQEEE